MNEDIDALKAAKDVGHHLTGRRAGRNLARHGDERCLWKGTLLDGARYANHGGSSVEERFGYVCAKSTARAGDEYNFAVEHGSTLIAGAILRKTRQPGTQDRV